MFQEYLKVHDIGGLLLPLEAYHPFPKGSEREAWEALAPEVRQELEAWGAKALDGYPALTASQYMAYKRSGDRQVFEKGYFARRKLLMGAVLAECVRHDGRYLDAVVDGLWCICEESSWTVSAHNDGKRSDVPLEEREPLPDVEDPYVDLFAAQTASVLAFTLYLMEDELNSVSPRIARRVRLEIDRRVLAPYLAHDDFWWMGIIQKKVNNWNPWIVSNVLFSSLILERDALRRTATVKKSMEILDRYLACMPEDGGCDEGPGYFNVAGASLLDCLEAIDEASGGRITFYKEPLIQKIGLYPLKTHIAGPYFLNFADCDAKPTINSGRVWKYGVVTGNTQLAELGARMQAMEKQVRLMDTPQFNRQLHAVFDRIPAPKENCEAAYMEMPLLEVFSWRKNGFYAAIKGGSNGENHNHNDVGSFVVYLDGEPKIVDMGHKVYTAKTFGPERYTLDNTRSMNHNVPMLGGMEQQEGAEFAAQNVQANEQGAQMELSRAYPQEAGVRSFKRVFRVREDGVVLRDTLELNRSTDVSWTFLLRDKPSFRPGEVHTGGLVIVHQPDLKQTCLEIPVTDERLSRNFAGSLWRVSLSKTLYHEDETFLIKKE